MEQQSIAPIETEYAGCRFRSRLEARWAVFFDALGIRWSYEDQGYELPSGRYLPDFRLLDAHPDLWAEVKGVFGHKEFIRLARAAIELPGTSEKPTRIIPKLLILGEIPSPGTVVAHTALGAIEEHLVVQHFRFVHPPRGAAGSHHVVRVIDDSYAWPRHWLEYLARTEFAPDWLVAEVIPGAVCECVSDAYRAARSARFEHGECG